MSNVAPASAPPSYKSILKRYDSSTANVKGYFSELPHLLEDGYPYQVSVAYLFLETEHAHNRALYCGVVKLHAAEAELADSVVNAQHLTRDGFLALYRSVFGKPFPSALAAKFEKAARIRDFVVHGKKVSDAEMRQVHVDIIEYAEGLNAELSAIAGFEPFGDLRGFKGAAGSLEKATTKWLLKGIGFSLP
jgi:hypothetical protein